jgi:hypothetical protein
MFFVSGVGRPGSFSKLRFDNPLPAWYDSLFTDRQFGGFP